MAGAVQVVNDKNKDADKLSVGATHTITTETTGGTSTAQSHQLRI